jgi:amidase
MPGHFQADLIYCMILTPSTSIRKRKPKPVLAKMTESLPLPLNIDLLQASMTDLADMLFSGQVTSVALVKAYIGMSPYQISTDDLANIERNNINGAGLRAVIQVAPTESVLAIAQSLDNERNQGAFRGPLHGIPILVKDSIATDPELGMNTSCGSTALRELSKIFWSVC